jgi:hypothetical protein
MILPGQLVGDRIVNVYEEALALLKPLCQCRLSSTSSSRINHLGDKVKFIGVQATTYICIASGLNCL